MHTTADVRWQTGEVSRGVDGKLLALVDPSVEDSGFFIGDIVCRRKSKGIEHPSDTKASSNREINEGFSRPGVIIAYNVKEQTATVRWLRRDEVSEADRLRVPPDHDFIYADDEEEEQQHGQLSRDYPDETEEV